MLACCSSFTHTHRHIHTHISSWASTLLKQHNLLLLSCLTSTDYNITVPSQIWCPWSPRSLPAGSYAEEIRGCKLQIELTHIKNGRRQEKDGGKTEKGGLHGAGRFILGSVVSNTHPKTTVCFCSFKKKNKQPKQENTLYITQERERERAKAREITPIERRSGAERGARGTVLHPAGC